MNVNLQLDAEAENRLRKAATEEGLTVEEYLERVVQLFVPYVRRAIPRTPEERVAAFEAWVESNRDITHVADDSRESIYEGRGE